MELHHVGVAVKSLETALGYYTDLFGLRRASEPVSEHEAETNRMFKRYAFMARQSRRQRSGGPPSHSMRTKDDG
ncbi:MAG: VOC family protein [Thermoanaerobaculia bacterium]